jgi:hypothetical protein
LQQSVPEQAPFSFFSLSFFSLHEERKERKEELIKSSASHPLDRCDRASSVVARHSKALIKFEPFRSRNFAPFATGRNLSLNVYF